MLKISLAASVASLAILGAHGTAHAQDEPIVLRYASFIPTTHVLSVHRTLPFMAEVERLSEGRVTFEFYPAEQIGKAKQYLDLLNSGTVDIAELATGYFSGDRLPMGGILEMPGLAQTSCEATAAMRAIGSPGGPVYESDFRENNIRALDFMAHPPYQIAPSRVPIASVDDLRGNKLRAAGGLMELSLHQVGAVPVSITSPETYTALERGTLDGVMFTYTLAETYEFNAVAKFGTYGFGFGSPGQFIFINEDKFQSLPQDIQQILLQAGETVEKDLCAFLDSNEQAVIADWTAKGQDIHHWTAEEAVQLSEIYADIPQQWIETLESRGKPAQQVYDAYVDALND